MNQTQSQTDQINNTSNIIAHTSNKLKQITDDSNTNNTSNRLTPHIKYHQIN